MPMKMVTIALPQAPNLEEGTARELLKSLYKEKEGYEELDSDLTVNNKGSNE